MGKHVIATVFLLIVAASIDGAPRSKNRTPAYDTVHDEKQTGDYNIRLHLKDFQIIALTNGAGWDGFGDYDYSYDYADFTIKPKPSSSTTTTPTSQSTSAAATSTQEPQTPNENASSTQSSTTSPPSTSSQSVIQISTEKLKPINAEIPSRPPSSTMRPIEDTPLIRNSSKIEINDLLMDSTDKQKTENIPSSPDRIKVQIIQSPGPSALPLVMGDASSDEIDEKNPAAQLGETVHYRKCLTGYTRDKQGKCRRLRRPGAYIPYGLSRLASDIAAKLTAATIHEE